MKKTLLITMVVFLILLLFSACGNEMEETPSVTISVEYKATEGGTIVGTATQSATVKEGEGATFKEVTAVPNEDYKFVGWDDGKEEPTRIDTQSESKIFTAKFEKIPKATVTYLESDGGYINGEYSQTLIVGEYTKEVVAVAISGYRFIGWDDGVTTEVRVDLADKDKTVTALFEKINYVYAFYEKTTGGRIVGATSQTLEKGETATEVVAVPDYGYFFKGWSDGVTTTKRQDVLYENLTVKAIFSNEVVATYKASENGYLEGETTQNLYFGNTTKEIRAVPDEGYAFIGWDDGVKDPVRTDKLTGDITVTALFGKIYFLNFECDEKYGTLEGETYQEVPGGTDSKAVTAIPGEGYSFVCWSNGEKSPTIVMNASHDITLFAYFSHESSGLSVVSIETENGQEITSNSSYIDCTVTVNDVLGGDSIINKTAQIRGRGNSTWKFPDKPYKIKFEEKQDLFGFGRSRDWVLLANYGDPSLVRNYIAYQTARNLSELYASPDSCLVEVYVNGRYQGVYLICEQVEVNEYRAEVDEDVSKLDTGYLIEMDEWHDGIYVSVNDRLSSSREYTIKFPGKEEITDEHIAFIKDYIEKSISAIEGDDYSRVTELIDVKSFAQMYLVAEIFKCPDVDYSSFFMYKDAGGKLIAGPVWDYDMAFGNVAHKGEYPKRHDYLWAKEKNPWFNGLLKHEEFVELVVSELTEHEQTLNSVIEACFDYAYENVEAMEKSFNHRKPISCFFTPNEILSLQSWQANMDQVRSFYDASLKYVKSVYLPK